MRQTLLLALLAAALPAHAAVWNGEIDVADGHPNPQTILTQPIGNGNQLYGILEKRPYGAFNQSHVGFLAWEYFPKGEFYDVAPQYRGTGLIVTGVLTQYEAAAAWSGNAPAPDGSIPSSGAPADATAGRLSASDLDFTLSATANAKITSVTLTLKHTPWIPGWDPVPAPHIPEDELFDPHVPFYNMSLTLGADILAPTSLSYVYDNTGAYGDVRFNSSEGNTSVFFYVTSYTWDVEIDADTLMEFNFAHPSAYFSLDTVALHVQAVPEPSTYAAIGGAALLWGLRRRRKA